MRRFSRDTWVAIAIFLALGVITVIAATQQTAGAELPSLSTFSSAPNGSKALMEWIGQLGFEVSNDLVSQFEVKEDTAVLLMLQPFSFLVTEEDWEAVDEWVEDGGLLVVVSQGFRTGTVFENYDFQYRQLAERKSELSAHSPDLTSPPLSSPAQAEVSGYLHTEREDFFTLYAVAEGPVAVAFEKGEGWVVLSTAAFPFTNLGLKQDGNPELVLNLLALAEEGAKVWFDEWHHGLSSSETQLAGPMDWLRFNPTGQAILYSFWVVFIGLALSGKMFGRPLPPQREILRRPELEYVSALANLKRRAGHRRDVLASYRHILKRELGRRYRLDPKLDDQTYITQLAKYDPNLNAEALRKLLAQLQQTNLSERSMVQLAAEAVEWINPKEVS